MTEWIISSTAIILIVIAMRGLLKGKISLRLQYGLWALVLVRLLVPFTFFDSSWSVSNVAQTLRQQPAIQEASASVENYELVYQQVVERYEQMGTEVSNSQLRQEAQQEVYDATYEELLRGAAQEGTDLSEEQLAEQTQQIVESASLSAQIMEALPKLWIAGMVLMVAVLVVSNLHFMWKLRRSRTKLELPQVPLKVYLTDYVATPCLFGIGRPDIYLTDEVTRDSQMQRHVIAHELSHYRQGDHIWSVLRSVCLVLHWYNPLVWAAVILSKRDAELACDEATIGILGEDERMAYGRTLIGMTCVKRDPSSLLLTATTMLGSKKTLKERITLIAAKPKTALYTLIACLLIASIAVGCTFTGASTEPTDDTLTPTGYDDGGIQIPMIYLNGAVYMEYNESIGETVPEGYLLVGTVIQEDNTTAPSVDLASARVGVGSYVFLDPEDDTYIYYWKLPVEENLPRRMTRNGTNGMDVTGFTGEPAPGPYTGLTEEEINAKLQSAVDAFNAQSHHYIQNVLYDLPGTDLAISTEIWYDSGDCYLVQDNGIETLFRGGTQYSNTAENQNQWVDLGSNTFTLELNPRQDNPILSWCEQDGELRIIFQRVNFEEETTGSLVHVGDTMSYTLDAQGNLVAAASYSITEGQNEDGSSYTSYFATTFQMLDANTLEIRTQIEAAYIQVLADLISGTTEPSTEPTETVVTKMPMGAFNVIFRQTGSMEMSVHLADGTSDAITLFKVPSSFSLGSYTEITEPDVSGCTEWIVLESGDGTVRLTVYHGESDYLYYEQAGYTFWYENADGTLEQNLRREFDTLCYNSLKRLSFAHSGTAAQAAQEYAERIYGTFRMGLTSGSRYRYDSYHLVSLEISNETENTVNAEFTYYFKPSYPQGVGVHMFYVPAEGAYEGWYETSLEVSLEKQSDGHWYVIDSDDLWVATQAQYEAYTPGTPDQTALDYLETVPTTLALIRQTEDETSICALAQLFCKTVTALPMAGNPEFDWNQLCTEDAFDHIGMQSLKKLCIDSNFYAAHALGSLDAPMEFAFVAIQGDRAVAYNSQLQIYFVHTEAGWMIEDVCQPFAGT